MLLVPFGDDLRFNEEQEWYTQFGNLTMLMDYMNAQSDMNIEVCPAFMVWCECCVYPRLVLYKHHAFYLPKYK